MIPAISGCKVALVGDFVRKSTDDISYYKRLRTQAERQKAYVEVFGWFQIEVPQIFTIGEGYFTMEYLPYVDYIQFVETSPVERIKRLLQRVLNYVAYSLKSNKFLTEYPENDLVDQQLQHPNFPKEYSYLAEYIYQLQINPLPIGLCHGDLTFSNLLFSKDSIAVVDFNDVPISSPIIDVVKLKQDAKWHYTSYLTVDPHDRRKIELVDDWFLCELETILLNSKISMRDYRYWQALNQFKILRNAKGDEHMLEYLAHTIREALT